MEAKEKAKEIYLSAKIPDYCFAKVGMDSDWKIRANKKNASYVVNQILSEYQSMSDLETVIIIGVDTYTVVQLIQWWENVLIEIEKL